MMNAARLYARHDLRIESVARPGPPAADEVLLRVEMAGICGSDIHNFHTGMWISRSPSIPGHEFCATVLEAGSKVVNLSPGDRVVADSRVPCGTCPACHAGRGYLCAGMGFVGEVNDGGFAPYTVHKAQQLLRLPQQDMPAELAVLAEPLAVALHAINRVEPVAGSTALVVGAGTIGMLCAMVLLHRGAERVLLAETDPRRRDAACEGLGLTAFDTATSPVPDVCIDATGSAAALAMVTASVARGGRIAVVGLYRDTVPLDMNAIVEGGITLAGCAAFDQELPAALQLLPLIAEPLTRLATHTIELEDINAWYETLASGNTPVQKVLIAH